MNGIEFGKHLKALRIKKGVGSAELSEMVNKATTYVSQLERGKIKKPDYMTSYKLLEKVGYDPDSINLILKKFNIFSPEEQVNRIEKDLQQINQEEMELYFPFQKPHNNQGKIFISWYESEKSYLKEIRENINIILNEFVEYDLSKAQLVLINVHRLMRSKENFNIFCDIFKHDISSFNSDKTNALLSLLNNLDENIEGDDENRIGEERR
ncbi:helix-turn-helix domain-containing protein [Alkalihalobacillus deserti]|uniref:helix-turn-helix domain-containing protein n=1 Tax=Alkalihalobacillus deserti TaxID=2879466 RepID=UPI001D136802|nr:helix-turn-helix domain-containing protein [Alkalihalobacillus deserti]